MKHSQKEPREIDTITDEDLNLEIVNEIVGTPAEDLEEPPTSLEAVPLEKDSRDRLNRKLANRNISASLEDEVEEELDKKRQASRTRFRLTWPTRRQLLRSLPFLAVIILGIVLRFWGLGDKPLHHDESLHAYYSLQLMHDMENWLACFQGSRACYHYDPLIHGPFQFHGIALVYKVSQWLGAFDNGVNTTTVRILAAILGSALVGLPYFLRDRLGMVGAWLACFLLAVSPGMVYFSRFAREDIYMAFFTLLLVVCAAGYLRQRKAGWLVGAAIALSLSYATKEATFLTIAIFGSFFGALLVWELGKKWRAFQVSMIGPDGTKKASVFYTSAPIALLIYWLCLVPLAIVFLYLLKALATYINDPKNTDAASTFVLQLETVTLIALPLLGVLLGFQVMRLLVREARGKLPGQRVGGLAQRVDPVAQPLLSMIVNMPWTHWFFALLAGWTVFLLLFSVLFSYLPYGLADGIWQGLYYWVQQIAVARGDQPWYYYLLLIPLYEQVGVVFGLVGLVRCLLRPTRFRLFLVYWFGGNLFIYSWASEKMPWMMIHLTLPLLLLAAIGLEPAVSALLQLIVRAKKSANVSVGAAGPPAGLPTRRRPGVLAGAALTVLAVLAVLAALLLLLPTLQNMYQVTYVHPADGPHEMMVYVQTTTDINTMMAKIDELDQKLYHGKHQLSIGLMDNGTWPMLWYVRDYPNVCHPYPGACPKTAQKVQVIVAGQEEIGNAYLTYASAAAGQQPAFLYKEYRLRSWWDEGYKPPPTCVVTAQNPCVGQQTWGGVGLGLWLSYGDSPPPNAHFDPGRAASNIWQWWWQRKAIGSTGGVYVAGLFIRNELGVTP